MILRLVLVLVAAAAVGAAAYAADAFRIPPIDPATATPMRIRPALYFCNALPETRFPKRRLVAPRGAERADTAWAGALREGVGAAGPAIPRSGWRFLARRAKVAAYAHDALRDPLQWLAVVRLVGSEWRLSYLGRCTPERVVRDFAVMTWTGSVRTSTHVAMSVRGGGCHRTPRDLRRVEVSYSRRSVNLLVLFRAIRHPKPPPGSNIAYACPADLRVFFYDVRLPGPIGNRELRDARTWPPKLVAGARP